MLVLNTKFINVALGAEKNDSFLFFPFIFTVLLPNTDHFSVGVVSGSFS